MTTPQNASERPHHADPGPCTQTSIDLVSVATGGAQICLDTIRRSADELAALLIQHGGRR